MSVVRALIGAVRARRTARRLKTCRLFDAAYYRGAYADVAASSLDPALHFARIGGPQFRNASAGVESRRVLSLEPSFRPGTDDPLLYLASHEVARALPHSGASNAIPLGALLTDLERAPVSDRLPEPVVVDIIVPIHNNAEKLKALLDTLGANTDPRHRVILINDASTEPQVATAIAAFSTGRANVSVLRNKRALGFAASVNTGLALSDNYKIVLNSDTMVPPGWVEELVSPMLGDETVASVTPFSNSSSFTGFPANRIELPVPTMGDLEAINGALRRLAHRDASVLTGVGFCMAMAPHAIDEVGPLDAEAFRGGYYEDTEWCYRARKAGYRNVLANRLLVGHDHLSASFGLAAKLAALGRSERAMTRMHPDYRSAMDAAYFADENRELRLSGMLLAACALEPPVARASGAAGEGADATAAYRSKTTVLHLSGAGDACTFTCHSPLYGRLEFAGLWSEAASVLKHLAPSRLVLGDLPPAAEAAMSAVADEPGTPPTVPTLELREPSLPFTVAVLGTPAHGTHPGVVKQVLDHVSRSGSDCRIVVFGEVPDDWLAAPGILKTGLYRTENVAFLLRHYRASVAWFPATRDGSFECTRLDALGVGLPVVSHDRGRLGARAPDHERWTIAPGARPDTVLAALLSAHREGGAG